MRRDPSSCCAARAAGPTSCPSSPTRGTTSKAERSVTSITRRRRRKPWSWRFDSSRSALVRGAVVERGFIAFPRRAKLVALLEDLGHPEGLVRVQRRLAAARIEDDPAHAIGETHEREEVAPVVRRDGSEHRLVARGEESEV